MKRCMMGKAHTETREPAMASRSDPDSFDAVILPHLDAAFNLARWLMRRSEDAEDVVQEAMVRALTYFPSFRGTNPRGWILQIVRNAAYASMKVNRGLATVSGDELDGDDPRLADPADNPETTLMKEQDSQRLARHLAAMPVDLREVLVLREIEELAYKDIAAITDAPVGTVMSRLWRARRLLAAAVKSGDRAA